MPQTIEKQAEIYTLQEDGTFVTTVVVNTEEVPTTEELIAEKEAKLLEIYAQLQALKEQQNN